MGDFSANIVQSHTNQYILIIQTNVSRESDAILTEKMEINAFICILFLAGALQYKKHTVWRNYWDTDGDSTEKVRLIMNQR
jgi:hypothetical protein